MTDTKETRGATEPICPACNGSGQISTGCDEWSSTICKTCEGTGLAAPQPQGGALTDEQRTVILDAMRSLANRADELKESNTSIDGTWCDAEEKAQYDAEVQLIERLRALGQSALSAPQQAGDGLTERALHADIMNLQCVVPDHLKDDAAVKMAYRNGHRDARHAAAELALAAPRQPGEMGAGVLTSQQVRWAIRSIGIEVTEYDASKIRDSLSTLLPVAAPLQPMGAGVPNGWKLVPVEPTAWMQTCIKDAWQYGTDAGPASAWMAGVKAAPDVPAASAQQDERETRTLADWLKLAPATWDSEYANLWAQLQVAQERVMEYRARWKGAQQVQADAGAVPAGLLDALRFYANGSHFTMHDSSAWDTVSGEPQNFYEDESNTATVEDGSVAKLALQGKFFTDQEYTEPPVEGEVFNAARPSPAGESDTIALLKRLKRDLMHARRFGSDTLQAFKSACSQAEGDIEEWLNEHRAAMSREQSGGGE